MNCNRALALTLALAALALTPHASAHAAEPAAAPPDLRGHWRLDAARSDDVQKKMKEAADRHAGGEMGGPPGGMPPGGMDEGMGGGPGGAGGPGGGPGMGGPPGEPPDRDGGRGPGGAGRGTLDVRAPRALEDFTLDAAGDTLVFLDRGLRVRLVVLDDRRAAKGRTAGGVELASGRWKKSKLLVEGFDPRGSKRTETWELLDQGKALRCASRMSLPGSGGTLEFARVWTSVPAATPAQGRPQ